MTPGLSNACPPPPPGMAKRRSSNLDHPTGRHIGVRANLLPHISLMNDIKTADRARMGQRNLKNLMLWHRMAKALKAQDVPVMAILKEFRTLAGERRGSSAAPPAKSYQVRVPRRSANELILPRLCCTHCSLAEPGCSHMLSVSLLASDSLPSGRCVQLYV